MSTEPSRIEPTADRPVNMLLDVSNTMVKLYKELFGRGPTKVRTYWTGPDALTVILEDTLTKAEQNMVTLGEQQRLRDTRMFFQYATVKEFCEPVERITGRTVRSFISGLDSEVNGLALETFIFYPRGQEGPSRATMSKV
ncbi:MAG: Na-translocating system protein MpsC family protein [Solirubrobacteraceae bacterium]